MALKGLIDVAGARMGGARRYVLELDEWIGEQRAIDFEVIGRNRDISLEWLIERERKLAVRNSEHCIAANNVSFVMARGRRTVLLRNALHFLYPGEDTRFSPKIRARLIAKTLAVRTMAGRADRLVVPSAAMAARVAAAAPSLADRVEVIYHPVSPIPVRPAKPSGQRSILCPVLPSPYKSIGISLRALLAALDKTPGWRDTAVWTTMTCAEAASERLNPADNRLRHIGRISPADVAQRMEEASAIFFPSRIESFGYPLAEARLRRVPVIAPDTDVVLEIGGDVVIPYRQAHPASLASCLERAGVGEPCFPVAENPFDRETHFRRLFDVDPD